MMGVFVQTNATGTQRNRCPVGYVIQENGCWEWIGGRNANGYGIMWVPCTGRLLRKYSLAHRAIYEQHFGDIGDGLTLDHLCRNRACVNPAHLEPVSHRLNVLRGAGPSAVNAAKSMCINGHSLSGDNVRRTKYGRRCKECALARMRRYRAASNSHPKENVHASE